MWGIFFVISSICGVKTLVKFQTRDSFAQPNDKTMSKNKLSNPEENSKKMEIDHLIESNRRRATALLKLVSKTQKNKENSRIKDKKFNNKS